MGLRGRFNPLTESILMSSDKSETSEENVYADGQKVIVDGLGISHFLMPQRCKNCDD